MKSFTKEQFNLINELDSAWEAVHSVEYYNEDPDSSFWKRLRKAQKALGLCES